MLRFSSFLRVGHLFSILCKFGCFILQGSRVCKWCSYHVVSFSFHTYILISVLTIMWSVPTSVLLRTAAFFIVTHVCEDEVNLISYSWGESPQTFSVCLFVKEYIRNLKLIIFCKIIKSLLSFISCLSWLPDTVSLTTFFTT